MKKSGNEPLPTPGARRVAWRDTVRARHPGLVRAVDRIGDPLVEWFQQRASDEAFLRRQFQAHLGTPLDLERPRRLVEKIQWLKLHDVTPLHRQCSDKIAVRDRVAEVIGPHVLVPLLDVLDDARQLTLERVTADRFAAKANHDCGSTVLCRGRDAFDWPGARASLARHLRRRYWRAQRELAYRGIEPRVMVEAMLPGTGDDPPPDYKFFCFAGRVEIVQVIEGRATGQTRTMMSPGWERLPVSRLGVPTAKEDPARPPRLGEMVAMAEALSAPFRFCRVDLYAIGDAIYFGEYAFYADGGYRPFVPDAWEMRLGAMVPTP